MGGLLCLSLCFGMFCDSHVTHLLPCPVPLWVSGSPLVTTAQSTPTFGSALTLPLQVACEGLDAAEQVHHLLAVGCK